MAITNLSGSYILNQFFGSVAPTIPGTLYFGFSTTAPNISGVVTGEPSGNGYARIGVTNNKTTFSTATTATLTNSIAVTFAESTGQWASGAALAYVCVWDALTGGNLWFFDTLTPSIIVNANTTVYFSASGITISMTNS